MRRFLRTLLSVSCIAAAAPLLQAQDEDGDGFQFRVTTIDGEEISHEDFMDKVVIVDFWGTWCPPCKKAIPHLIKLHEKYADKGLVILGLNYERGENPLRTVRAFADKSGIPYRLALGTKEIQDQVENFGGYPTMLFFKRGMRLDSQESGFQESKVAAMEEWIETALAEKVKKAAPAGPVKKSVTARGGKVLRVGDGKHAVLVALVHPKMPADPAFMKSLRALATEHDAFVLSTVSRDDVDGAKADYILSHDELRKAFSMGSAFPAYKLYDAKGMLKLRSAGRGAKLQDELLRAVEAVAGPKKQAKEPAAKPPAKAAQKPAVQPAKKPAKKPARKNADKPAARKRRGKGGDGATGRSGK